MEYQQGIRLFIGDLDSQNVVTPEKFIPVPLLELAITKSPIGYFGFNESPTRVKPHMHLDPCIPRVKNIRSLPLYLLEHISIST